MILPPLSDHLGNYACFLLGLGLLAYGFRSLWNAWGTQDWPSTEGRVLFASTTESSDEDGNATFQSQVSYEYQVGPTLYHGDRVNPGPARFGQSFSSASQALGGRVEGHPCLVYYDPKAPDRAVLTPGPTLAHYAVTLLGALFAALSLKDMFSGQP